MSVMRMGVGLETAGSVDDVVERARALAAKGHVMLWTPQIFGWDSLTTLAVVGREVPTVGLGTAVIPIHPRHPAILAAQALTVQSVTGGRLVLGIGLSHQIVVENMWGLRFERPARYMSEYLSVLMPLLQGEKAEFAGDAFEVEAGPLEAPGATAPTVLIAALGTEMLGVAASQAAGTVTWMVGPKTLSGHIVPTIESAARQAGRQRPEVVVHLPVCVTSDPAQALERADKVFAMYGYLPSYRAMLDRESASSPSQVAVVGDEEQVASAISRIFEAGATAFSGAAFGTAGEIEKTQELLASLAGD